MMMVDMDKYCHCGAKIAGVLKVPKNVSVIFAPYSYKWTKQSP
jgi:hypothetical protein